MVVLSRIPCRLGRFITWSFVRGADGVWTKGEKYPRMFIIWGCFLDTWPVLTFVDVYGEDVFGCLKRCFGVRVSGSGSSLLWVALCASRCCSFWIKGLKFSFVLIGLFGLVWVWFGCCLESYSGVVPGILDWGRELRGSKRRGRGNIVILLQGGAVLFLQGRGNFVILPQVER